MRRDILTMTVVFSMAVLIVGGCANKEVVKSEEPVAITEPSSQPTAKPADQPKTQQILPEQAKSSETSPQTPPAVATSTASALETIYFDFDKSELSKNARESLNKNADILLKSKTGMNIRIEGHCDERGSAEYNLALGERRAKSALQYLVTMGVKQERLSVISYGKEKPAVQGSNEDAWSKNRRDEFVPSN